ncbi:MAG: hypothetical protein P9E24_15000 [Candidatus Competibacter sp.]|nr:hypothetical protein [Candidatus Competibacter sp.]
MKLLRITIAVLALFLSGTTVYAQGFNMKSFPNGLGKSDMMYRFLVPEGVTVTNKKGEVMKGGSIVTVPGSSIKLLEPAYAQEQAKNSAFMSSFMNASQYFAMSADKVRNHAVIGLKVPEGVTVEGYGKTVTGGSELVLMVANAGSETMQDTNPPGYWDTAGWDMK